MTKLHVGHIQDIDKKGSRTFLLGETEIALFHLSDGSIHAVENSCPHKQGRLSEGMVCGTAIHCPLHDWKIDLRSGKVQDPDEGCVHTYNTEVDPASGAIYITF
ncbi:nitrite reductase small subunit NirD [Paenibacillus sp. PsM32]|uniref:nitrite reductase small subunit NirD n=1 Tax=Paenibacillus sp. PsM32 TaxID=3030536 RepID=UPI00263ABD7E|nr:nitrite reductase small subunit NirD [Paenibacillus sp. PsM32]MDN4620181.1 nitrite reductase small subunit NirD [Paenibacillus sp. PsM32]